MDRRRNVEELEQHRAELLRSEVRRLSDFLAARGAERVILVGSAAGGRTDVFTDIDIVAVIPSDEPFVERIARFYREAAPRVASDVLLYTPEEFEQARNGPFLQNALAGGVVLYEKESG